MSLLSFEPFLRDDIYACIYHFRIRYPKTYCISASYADLSPSKKNFSRHLSPDKTRKSHLDLLPTLFLSLLASSVVFIFMEFVSISSNLMYLIICFLIFTSIYLFGACLMRLEALNMAKKIVMKVVLKR